MTTLRLHAPTTNTIKDCRSGVLRAQANLGLHILVGCDSPALENASTKLAIIKNMLAGLERDLDEALAARQPGRYQEKVCYRDPACCPECAATDAEWARFEAERPSHLSGLERVRQAEKEALDEASLWHSFTPPMDHPDGCGCPGCVNVALVSVRDQAIHAGANTVLDRRVG